MAKLPLPSWGYPTLQSGEENLRWPTGGQSGYITLAVLGVPNSSERGGKCEVAECSAERLHNPCRLGGPALFRAGRNIKSGPMVGPGATILLPFWGSPTRRSGEENLTLPTGGLSGFLNPAVTGVPSSSWRGGLFEVAHWWAEWLHNPCRAADFTLFTTGIKI